MDSLMGQRALQCPDIADNSSILFTKYIAAGNIDSATTVLQYWKEKCGINEPVQRAIYMLALAKAQPVDTLTGENIVTYLYKYKYRYTVIKQLDYSVFYSNQLYFDFVPVGQEFDKELIRFFGDQLSKQRQGSVEHLLCLVYAVNPDTLSSQIKNAEYATTRLYKQYNTVMSPVENSAIFNLAWLTGVWVPTGELTKLGIHPELGFQMGVKKKKMNYDLTMCFRFINSPEAYLAKRDNTNNVVESTRHFFGGYIGIDVGRDVYAKNKNEVQVLSGFGFDGWDALTKNDDTGLRSKSVASYNFNVGLGYRRYLKNNTTYIGIRGKYNFVNYTLNHVVDFTGNPVSITFVIGGLAPRYYK